MKKSFIKKYIIYLLSINLTFFLSQTLATVNQQRCDLFNESPSSELIAPCTKIIMQELHEPKTITADDFKSLMASVIIHDDFLPYPFQEHGIAPDTEALFNQHEICRLTELFTINIFQKGIFGFNMAISEDLYVLCERSGFSSSNFDEWFLDVFKSHQLGIMKKLTSKQPQLDAITLSPALRNIQGRFAGSQRVAFGTIPDHPIAGSTAVFVSTYNLSIPALMKSIVIELPNDEDRTLNRIVIQEPNFDIEHRDPFSIRAHPLFKNQQVNIVITNTHNTVGMAKGIANIHTHDGTFSPNDAHLTGLPLRPLLPGEVYSFISHVSEQNDHPQKVRTYHILLGSIDRLLAFSEAFFSTEPQTLGDPLLTVKPIGQSELTYAETIFHDYPEKNLEGFINLLQHPIIRYTYPDLNHHLASVIDFAHTSLP
jgi:hypothetical protein